MNLKKLSLLVLAISGLHQVNLYGRYVVVFTQADNGNLCHTLQGQEDSKDQAVIDHRTSCAFSIEFVGGKTIAAPAYVNQFQFAELKHNPLIKWTITDHTKKDDDPSKITYCYWKPDAKEAPIRDNSHLYFGRGCKVIQLNPNGGRKGWTGISYPRERWENVK